MRREVRPSYNRLTKMKTLPSIKPTREQLALISENRYGIEIIRGAAGSGKTSTAILRLRSLLYMVRERLDREGIDRPVRILVLTFNRTLSGYVRVLARDQIKSRSNAELTIDTFGRWAMRHLNRPAVIRNNERDGILQRLAAGLPLSPSYVAREVDYLLGRFEPENFDEYLTAERTGRGLEPRVSRVLRKSILDNVVRPYKKILADRALSDWNDVAVLMARAKEKLQYDIVIVDEAQDFSANQLRAIKNHVCENHAITFVIDTVQRIYARGFSWQETGFDLRGARYHRLTENHRNTRQIARFAAGLLSGMSVEADGTMPNLASAFREGPLPRVLRGRYSAQIAYALRYIAREVNLKTDTVAFLAPLGGGFFDYLRTALSAESLPYVDITREADWPGGSENIALCTFHSAKGLEFDHVIILGLNDQNTGHEDAEHGDQLAVLRRLLAVGVARARLGVILGYKPGEESDLVHFFEDGTFEEYNL
jgi:DNA helicase IV